MEWLYFEMEDGKVKIFRSYLSDQNIRGNVRNVTDPAVYEEPIPFQGEPMYPPEPISEQDEYGI